MIVDLNKITLISCNSLQKEWVYIKKLAELFVQEPLLHSYCKISPILCADICTQLILQFLPTLIPRALKATDLPPEPLVKVSHLLSNGLIIFIKEIQSRCLCKLGINFMGHPRILKESWGEIFLSIYIKITPDSITSHKVIVKKILNKSERKILKAVFQQSPEGFPKIIYIDKNNVIEHQYRSNLIQYVNKSNQLKIDGIISITTSLLKSILFLEQNNAQHCAIWPEIIGIEELGENSMVDACLMDLSSVQKRDSPKKSIIQPYLFDKSSGINSSDWAFYRSPESIIEKTNRHGDVFSLGMTLLWLIGKLYGIDEIFSGDHLRLSLLIKSHRIFSLTDFFKEYDNSDKKSLYPDYKKSTQYYVDQTFKIVKIKFSSHKILNIIHKMLTIDPSSRISSVEALNLLSPQTFDIASNPIFDPQWAATPPASHPLSICLGLPSSVDSPLSMTKPSSHFMPVIRRSLSWNHLLSAEETDPEFPIIDIPTP